MTRARTSAGCWALAGAISLTGAGMRPAVVHAQQPPPAIHHKSIDALDLLASQVMGVQGQVAGLRSKIDALEAAAAHARPSSSPAGATSENFGERCCTGEVDALQWAWVSLRADVERV